MAVCSVYKSIGRDSFSRCNRDHDQRALVVVSDSREHGFEVSEEIVFMKAKNGIDNEERRVIENDDALVLIDSNKDV